MASSDAQAAIKRLTELQEAIADADRKRSRAQGSLDAATAQLKTLGANSLKEAVTMQEALGEELETLETDFVAVVEKLDAAWGQDDAGN